MKRRATKKEQPKSTSKLLPQHFTYLVHHSIPIWNIFTFILDLIACLIPYIYFRFQVGP